MNPFTRPRDKSEKSDASNGVNLTGYRNYAAATNRLRELSQQLGELRVRRDQLRAQACRMGSDAKHFINQNAASLPFNLDFDSLARKVIHGGDPLVVVAEARKSTTVLLPPPSANCDRSDIEKIAEIDSARGAIDIIELALTLLKKDIQHERKLAMPEILNSLKPHRERISREIAEAFLTLVTAINQERELVQQLRVQDDELPAMLRPHPFPSETLSHHPAITAWVSELVDSGVIDPSDPRLAALDLGAVAVTA